MTLSSILFLSIMVFSTCRYSVIVKHRWWQLIPEEHDTIGICNLHSSILIANEVWGKVIFLHISVILFTWGEVPATEGGVPGQVPPFWQVPLHGQVHPAKAGTPLAGTPLQGILPGRYTPLGQVHPHLEQCMLGDTGNKLVVCILLECFLVHKVNCSWSWMDEHFFK